MKSIIVLLLLFCFFPIWSQIDSIDFSKAGEYSLEQIQALYQQAGARKDSSTLVECEYWFHLYDLYNSKGAGPVAGFERLLALEKNYSPFIEQHDFVAHVRQKIAGHYMGTGFHQEALNYFKKLLLLNSAENDQYRMAHDHANIAQTLLGLKDSTGYLQHTIQAVELATLVNDSFLLAILYTHMGSDQLDQKAYEQAITYSQKAAPLALSHRVHIAGWSVAIEGIARQRLGQYRLAIPIFHQAIGIYKTRYETNAIAKTYRNLSTCFQQLNQLDSAYYYLLQSKHISDSLFTAGKAAKIEELVVLHNKRGQEQELKIQAAELLAQNERSNRQRQIITTLIVGVILVLLMAMGLWKFLTERIRNQKLLTQQREQLQEIELANLEKQLEIETIQSLIKGQEEERQRFARELHDGLGGMLSALRLQLDQTDKNLPVSLQDINKKALHMLSLSVQEVRTIARNSLPEALEKIGLIAALKDYFATLKTPGSPEIDFQQYGEVKLNKKEQHTVYRIIQELVNNAIKHAQCNEIMVLLIQNETDVAITVEDDGQGFEPANSVDGSGLHNLRQRVQFLKGELQIDSSPSAGSSFIIQFDADLSE